MMTKSEFDKGLEKFLDGYLEDYSLEEFFEEFNLTPLEVFLNTYYSGLIDDEDLERVLTSDI